MAVLMTFSGAKILMKIENNIKNGTFSELDISELSRFLREEIITFDEDVAKEFLIVLSDALKCAVLKAPHAEWADKYGDYFGGNMVKDKNSFYPRYEKLYKSKKFGLNDIVDFLNDIINDFNGSRNDFYLRIPEVVLRDDVTIDKSKLITLGKDVSNIINKI